MQKKKRWATAHFLLWVADESLTHLFLVHFSSMFLTFSDLFLCQIMEYSPTLCFAGVN